ncbi:MAG TPA: gluconate 2-dehydrogenase subunit 3 family protein [Terriglobia bacterium]|nr:gluconate 2-dehydrogenase subunit 3 family protein [Terriglobia bacterium]
MNNDCLTRRQMLQRLGGIIGLAAVLPLPARSLARAQGLSAVANAPVSLTSAEAETLRAIIARIIPADENGPGALEARADRYIDRALAGALKNQRSTYAAGLAAIDAYAQSAKGSVFAKLSTSDQDLILTEIQSDRATGFAGGGSGQFFNLVRTHTIQGTFSDPFYGGNENFIGWDLIGYPGARVVVSPNLQRMDIKPESSRKSAYDYSMFIKGEF